MFLSRALFRPTSIGRAAGRCPRLGFSRRLLDPAPSLLLSLPLPRAHFSTETPPTSEATSPSPGDLAKYGVIIKGPPNWEMDISIHKDGVQFMRTADPSRPLQQRTVLESLWLRDNCRCSECVNPDTEQRQLKTFEISPDIHPVNISIPDPKDSLQVQWDDGHISNYSFHFLNRYLYYGNSKQKPPVEGLLKPGYWGSNGYFGSNVAFSEVMSDDSGLLKLLNKIRTNGYAFVTGTPYDSAEPTRELLERIAFIRTTHYGGFYDFIPDLAMADTAYTNLALPAHTDTTYFTDPAGLQAFHLLSHHPAPGEEQAKAHSLGGASLLVDGFRIANKLRRENRWAFDVLCKVRLPWHASGNKGITITPDRLYPVFEKDDRGYLHKIRWNNDDRGVVPFDRRGSSPSVWYKAARVWNSMLCGPENQYWVQLRPGTVLIFDNWRVLHGRSAFTGVRRICGGYINRDDYISRWRNLFHHHRDVLMANVRG